MQEDFQKTNLHLGQSIVLIGFMGTGKSTVGKTLSHITDLPFYDTDNLIECQEKTSIKNIFSKKGESYFRTLEVNVLKNALAGKQKILATGGGIVKDPANAKLIKSNSIAIALKTDLKTIINRLKSSAKRPLLPNDSFEETLTRLYNERVGLYDFAHLIVHTDEKTPLEIAREIYDSTLI
ncbi:MAG TPA: shikimate kinase [Bacillota bacterium]|nr:shikimate kinase [Bacillota bacterium]